MVDDYTFIYALIGYLAKRIKEMEIQAKEIHEKENDRGKS